MNYKGVVTTHNFKLCQFTLDDKITVYAGHLFSDCCKPKLPALNEEIVIRNGLLYKTNIFLTIDSKITCTKYCDEEQNKLCQNFVRIIKDLQLGGADLLKIYEQVGMLSKLSEFTTSFITKVTNNEAFSSEDIILSIISLIDVHNEEEEDDDDTDDNIIFSELLPDFNIKTPSKLNNCCKNEINGGPYWNYGIHSNNKYDFLIGYLHVSVKLGFIVLSDAVGFIVCIITPDDLESFSKQLSKFLGKFVLLNKYQIFTEFYKEQRDLMYLFFNIKDLKLLDLKYVESNPKLENTPENSIELRAKILHKASLSYKANQVQCFLHCEIEGNIVPSDKSECLLRIEQNNILLHPTINVGNTYRITIKNTSSDFIQQISSFTETSTYDIPDISLKTQAFTLPTEATVTLENSEYTSKTLLTVKEADKLLKSGHKGPISFEGIIVKKKFLNPLPSRIRTRVNNKAFGTPGSQVHQLIIKNCSKTTNDENEDVDGKSNTATVFMPFWECLQCPLGLIPNMRVAVRYFACQGGKYFKPTFLSVIQPLSYEHPLHFNSCYNLLNNTDWGPKCFLGNGNQIPTDILVWGPTETLKITYLQIQHFCAKCKKKILENQIQCCDETVYEMTVMLVMRIRDRRGESDVITKSEEVLRVILDYTESEWKDWCKCLKIIGQFSYTSNGNENDGILSTDLSRKFTAALSLQIDIWNETEIACFDLKCRKLVKSARDNTDAPKWYCIEARQSALRI